MDDNLNNSGKTKNLFSRIWARVLDFYKTKTKRKIIFTILFLLVIFFVVKPKGIDPNTITVVPVESLNLVSTVKSSGKVTSVTDLNLSFKSADLVSTVNVTVGQKVKKGQVLAMLESGNEQGLVTQALGNLRSAKASLQKLKEGATSEELRVSQIAYENAVRDYDKIQKNQDALVENARRALFSQYLEAVPEVAGISSVSPTISGSYNLDTEAVYKITLYSTGSGFYYTISGQSAGSGSVDLQVPKPLGTEGLFLTFPSGFSSLGASWVVNVPNKTSAYYAANYSAYVAAKQNRELALSQAQSTIETKKAELDLKLSTARTADIEIAEANVTVAEGAYQNALANLERKYLRSPEAGTITRVDIKVGELAEALKPVIVLQDVSNLYIESDINESNIKDVTIGQSVSFTVDAFGTAQIFDGVVTNVEPSATIVDGIVNYKIKTSINDGPETDTITQTLVKNIKPGMNTNITITTNVKNNVLAVPGASLVNENGVIFAKVITNEKRKKFENREVITGAVGDGNLTEIVSGLNVGEKVAIVENKK